MPAARRFFDPHGAEVPLDGTSPLRWRLSAYVLAARDWKVLMVRQPPAWGGRWELPGGGVEVGESLLEGAARECREETGCHFVASSPGPIHVAETWFSGPAGYSHAVLFWFEGSIDGDVDRRWAGSQGEVADIAWLDPRALGPTTVHRLHWPVLTRTVRG
jgi:8-oxo-dGTP pyrophosphatase MutT (NUDIX family)